VALVVRIDDPTRPELNCGAWIFELGATRGRKGTSPPQSRAPVEVRLALARPACGSAVQGLLEGNCLCSRRGGMVQRYSQTAGNLTHKRPPTGRFRCKHLPRLHLWTIMAMTVTMARAGPGMTGTSTTTTIIHILLNQSSTVPITPPRQEPCLPLCKSTTTLHHQIRLHTSPRSDLPKIAPAKFDKLSGKYFHRSHRILCLGSPKLLNLTGPIAQIISWSLISNMRSFILR
jgi:hypothetical protein